MSRSGTAFLVLSLAHAAAVGCGPNRERLSVDERQQRQRGNIAEGADEGDLTRGETRRLRERSRDIQDDKRDALRDDGRVDRGERREIRRDQRRLGEDIREQRHDDDTR
jgi:hypothetical protein